MPGLASKVGVCAVKDQEVMIPVPGRKMPFLTSSDVRTGAELAAFVLTSERARPCKHVCCKLL